MKKFELIVGLIVLFGIFLTILHISGGRILTVYASMITTAIILLIAIIFYFRNKADYYKRILRRIVIYGGLGLILYLTPSSLLVVVNQYKAESLQYLSVGHRPTERNAPQIQALKGRHLYYALANVDKSINSSNIEIFKSLRN